MSLYLQLHNSLKRIILEGKVHGKRERGRTKEWKKVKNELFFKGEILPSTLFEPCLSGGEPIGQELHSHVFLGTIVNITLFRSLCLAFQM